MRSGCFCSQIDTRSTASGATAEFAATVLVGDWAGAVDASADLTAMGFDGGAGVEVSSRDGWTGDDTGVVAGAWSVKGVSAPGGLYRVFTLVT